MVVGGREGFRPTDIFHTCKDAAVRAAYEPKPPPATSTPARDALTQRGSVEGIARGLQQYKMKAFTRAGGSHTRRTHVVRKPPSRPRLRQDSKNTSGMLQVPLCNLGESVGSLRRESGVGGPHKPPREVAEAGDRAGAVWGYERGAVSALSSA